MSCHFKNELPYLRHALHLSFMLLALRSAALKMRFQRYEYFGILKVPVGPCLSATVDCRATFLLQRVRTVRYAIALFSWQM